MSNYFFFLKKGDVIEWLEDGCGWCVGEKDGKVVFYPHIDGRLHPPLYYYEGSRCKRIEHPAEGLHIKYALGNQWHIVRKDGRVGLYPSSAPVASNQTAVYRQNTG